MKKKKRKYDEVNYWETMADSLIALLLCILLIALLLILYLVRMPEEHIYDETETTVETSWDRDDDDETGDDDIHRETTTPYDHGDDNHGGGGGGGGNDNPGQNNYPRPGDEGYGKAAVYVEIVDGETDRTIKYANVEFELYDMDDQLQVLSTYYPDKIDFKKFLTDEVGTFYLPEKVPIEHYYLHALTRVPGYDYAADTELEIEEGYEWNEPYTARILMFPEKNIIRVRLRDMNTGRTLTGASFDVVAAEDITTKDGTIRCKEGDIVDTIHLDENGYGESKELYLGKYLLQQDEVPQYYAKIMEDTEVLVESKAKTTETKVEELREEKTKVSITVVDELYDTKVLEGATFTITSEDGKYTDRGETDENGKLVFTDLAKDTTYTVRQTGTMEGYAITLPEVVVTVDVHGLIHDKADYPVALTNRMLRMSVGVRDMLFRGQVSDVNIAVCDASGELIKAWDSSAIEQTLEGLAPGEYRIIIAGNEKTAKRVTLEDKASVQDFQFNKWTTTDIGVLLGLGLFLLAIIIFLIVYLTHRAREKAAEKEEKENNQIPEAPMAEDPDQKA